MNFDRMSPVVADLVEAGVPLDVAMARFERELFNAVLQRTRGRVELAARMLGIHRNTMAKHRRKHRLLLDSIPPRKRCKYGDGR